MSTCDCAESTCDCVTFSIASACSNGRARDRVLGQQVAHPVEVVARFHALRLRRGQLGARRLQAAVLVHAVEPRQQLAGLTRSPMSTLRSISRPSMRKDWLTSVCACTRAGQRHRVADRAASIVIARTGRISGAGASSARRQADSSGSVVTASARIGATRLRVSPVAGIRDTWRPPSIVLTLSA